MKYVCKICGYVYDEEKETAPFIELPDTWVCPLCGAAKSDFEPQGERESFTAAPKTSVKLDSDMKKLSAGQLAAVCSNLARGCEKQYKQEESELFTELARYFAAVTPLEETADVAGILELVQNDLESGYGDVHGTAEEKNDRGALRVCVWGEKVTRILNTLLQKYEREGEDFLANTEIWVCSICGFVSIGENPPGLCPVCKVPDWKFEKIEGRVRK